MPDLNFPVHPETSPRLGSVNGVRVREDTLFTDHKGEAKEAVRKRTEKALGALGEVLTKVLAPEEAVLYVVRCQAPVGALEQATMGWYVYKVSGSVLVFTNRRLLALTVGDKGFFGTEMVWKKGLRSVLWGDIEEAKIKGWINRVFQLKYRNGSKEAYWKLGGGDAKKIKLLVNAVFAAGARESTSALGMVSLCPGCWSTLTPRVYQCAKCGLKFKDESTMLQRALIIPGGGYFYLGYTLPGVGSLIVELYLLALTLIFVVAGLGGPDMLANPGQPPTEKGVAIVAAIFILVILGLEKGLGIFHCRRFVRGFIPAS